MRAKRLSAGQGSEERKETETTKESFRFLYYCITIVKDIDQGTEINPQCISKRNVRGEKGLTTKEKKGPLGDENQEATSTRSQKPTLRSH